MVDFSYWDGVTDYTCRHPEKETEQRPGKFGDKEFEPNVEQ